MSNLGKRVLTAVVLIPLAVSVIAWLEWPWLAGLLALFVLAAAWEWGGLAGWGGRPVWRAGYLLLTAAAMLAGALWLAPAVIVGTAALASAGWLLALAAVVQQQRHASLEARWPAPVWAMLGWLLLLPAWLSLVHLHRGAADGPALVLMLMAIIWLADSGAYFAGRRFGRRKLASRVSPGKSWEGVIGGAVVALAAALAYAWGQPAAPLAGFMALAVVTVFASVLGDLTESLVKRLSGIKDSGSLLPGHGGVLDRVDSLTAAAPVYVAGLHLLDSIGARPMGG